MKKAAAAVAIMLLSAAAQAASFTVRVHETVTIDIPGATAAYVIDPSIAEVRVAGSGRVAIIGRTAGTTQLMAVTAMSTASFLVTVASAVSNVPRAAAAQEPITRAESRYSSASPRLQTSISMFKREGDRDTELHLVNVHHYRRAFARSSDAFPSVSYRIASPRRTMTILDELIDISPLTIRSTQVRGFHLVQGPLELHGGYAASTMYEDLFLPADRRWMASASYGIDSGAVRLVPSLFMFFSAPEGTGARRGLVGSLAMERRRGESFFARGEIAVSRSLAASAEVRYETDADRLKFRASYKPLDFPTLGLSELPGTHGELDWNRRATSRLSIDTYGTYDRVTFAGRSRAVAVGNVNARYAVTPRLSLLSGLTTNFVGDDASWQRTIGVPLGLAFEMPHFGSSAVYRVLDSSFTDRHGDSLRLTARAGTSRFQVDTWAERQRGAPALEVIFRETAGLELTLLRLGLSVQSPEDLARVLRDNAALINLGFIEGVTINLTPRRTQAGLSVSSSTLDGRNRIRLHVVFDRAENVSSAQDTAIATFTYSRRLLETTEVFGSFSSWRSGPASHEAGGSAYEIGLRHRIDGVPEFLRRTGTIEGIVYLDLDMDGQQDPGTARLEGLAVTLDGATTVRSDKNGAYSFRGVKSGQHSVAATLDPTRPGFFTTASRVEVEAPARVNFGVVWSSARISGRVVSDADTGISGVVITATAASGKAFTVTTDSEGAFNLDTPDGNYALSLATESLPPGYTISGTDVHQVEARADRPRRVAFDVRALRSIAGTIPGATEVKIQPPGRTTPADATGNFVFRSLPSGTFTVSALVNGRTVSRTVTLPPQPASETIAIMNTPPLPPAPRAAGFRVVIGAYRIVENALNARTRAERLGFHAEIKKSGSLNVVSIGPVASREQAEEQAARLSKAGLEALVVPGANRSAAR